MIFAAGFPMDALARLDARAGVDILLIAVLLYYTLNLLRGTRAVQMTATILLLVLAYKGAELARLEMVQWMLNTLLPYFAIALIVLFQPEIRRVLARAGRNPFWKRLSAGNSAGAHDDVVLALSHFSQHRIGALIVLEREVGLRTYIESGIPLDAVLSYDLLVAVFRPESPMHDGAVIVQGDKVAAAACFLPLSLNPMLSNQLGTRHRAAIGVTEESDAIAVMVSEETGAIALAAGGAIELNLTPQRLAERLAAIFVQDRPPAALAAPPGSTPGETADDR